MRRGLLLALSLGIASAACGRADKAPEKRELRKVRMAASGSIHWAPIMIAQAEGFFRDEGIEVENVPIPSAQEDLVALVSGHLDVKAGPTHASFFSAVQQGAKIRIVAGQGYLARDGCAYYGVVKRRNLGPDSNLKRLRASRDGLTRFVTERMLEHTAVDIKKLEVNRLTDAVAASALKSGSLDAVATGEPALTRMKSIGALWLTAEKVVPDFQWGTITFGERLLYKDRDTGVRFIRAYSRGVAQYLQGKTERNVAIIAKQTGESPEMLRSACWLSFRPDLSVNWQSLEEFQAWAKKEGLIKHIVSRDQAMDTTLVTESISRSTTRNP